jgi:cell division transport system permease protein
MSSTRRVSNTPSGLSRWLLDHTRAISATLDQVLQRPFSTFLTAFVIGVTLALPAGLYSVLGSLDAASSGLKGSLRASLFLRDELDEEAGRSLAAKLARRAGVAEARYISRDDALAEFKAHSGFGEALDILDSNPLPAVIVVTPDRKADKIQASALLDAMTQLPEVESARLDREWLERLYAILDIVERLVLLIGSALSIAVLVVVGNTIRLDIAARREEIVVLKVIGAPNAFIRRPFLYTGLWYGLSGALLACLMVLLAQATLSDSAATLSGLYGAGNGFGRLTADTAFSLFGIGALLGWLAAFWTVGRHLGAIEPD